MRAGSAARPSRFGRLRDRRRLSAAGAGVVPEQLRLAQLAYPDLRQPVGPVLHGLHRCSRLFRQRRVLLRALIHLRVGLVDLFDAVAHFCRGAVDQRLDLSTAAMKALWTGRTSLISRSMAPVRVPSATSLRTSSCFST